MRVRNIRTKGMNSGRFSEPMRVAWLSPQLMQFNMKQERR